jgi:hypothetical protein
MKKLLLLIFGLIYLIPSQILGEEGEFQILFGIGGYFPITQETKGFKVYSKPSYNVPLTIYGGITDNFDIGFAGSFSRIKDIRTERTHNNIKGNEYSNYNHVSLNARLRYNLYPGLFYFVPHIFIGIGTNIEIFEDREFYLSDDTKLDSYDENNYTTAKLNLQAGIDITSRIWWVFLLNLEAVYNYSLKGNHYFGVNFNLGFDWMISTYGGR